MNRNSTKKQILLFIIGSAMNLGLFCLSKYTAFPLWLDYTGSLYITVFCGAPLAFLSLVLHTAILIALIDGWTALLSVIPILFICCIGYLFGKEPDKSLQGGLAAAFLATVIAFVSGTVTLLCFGGLPHRYEHYSELFELIVNSSGRFFGAVTVSSVITLTDVLVTIALFTLVYMITPKNNESLIFKR